MPWNEVKPMDQRILFIADHLRDRYSFSELCSRYGISRKSGYKWLGRYRREGVEGLEERSRRPHHSATAYPFAVRQAVIALRTDGGDVLGPKKIQALLARRYPDMDVPSRTTIYLILKRAGLIEAQRRRRRVSPHPGALNNPSTPNGLWSADYKGQFKLRNGQWCYPLTVMDHASRYLLGCQALAGTEFAPTRACFERLFREHGLPERLRTDNGAPFASTGAAGLSRLSIWWIRLGIVPERIKPGRPQQNGRHERMHRTLKRAVTRPVAADMPSQQQAFDQFCQRYNEQRPHEGLEQNSPGSRYVRSVRAFPTKLPELEYPSYYECNKVASGGLVYWRSMRIYIGYLLTGQCVGFEPVGDGLWDVYFGPLRIGHFDERLMAGEKDDYLTLKV